VPTKSVLKIYDFCLGELRKKRVELATLQLTGKLEDRLTKEFSTCVYTKSGSGLIALSNVGNRGEQKVDLAILEGDFSRTIAPEKAKIRTLIEAKYIRNVHRFGPGNAQDELQPTLKDLRRQLKSFRKKKHGGFRVKLSGRRKDIYGLLFVSYVRPDDQDDEEEAFLRKVRKVAKKSGLTYNDLADYPWLQPVYERQPVEVFKRKFRASLRAGLWRAG